MHIFSELPDNGLLGCSRIVHTDSQRWVYFGVISSQLVRCGWMVGLVQNDANRSAAFVLSTSDQH